MHSLFEETKAWSLRTIVKILEISLNNGTEIREGRIALAN